MSLTDRLYARCAGQHRYSEATIRRDYQGHTLDLRVCLRCGVPEKPKLKTASVGGRKPKVQSSYWD